MTRVLSFCFLLWFYFIIPDKIPENSLCSEGIAVITLESHLNSAVSGVLGEMTCLSLAAGLRWKNLGIV